MISQQKSEAVTLAQFLSIKDRPAYRAYLAHSEQIVQERGGRRAFGVRVDQILAGGDMPYQELVIDKFPSSQAASSAFKAAQEAREAALDEAYALLVQPMSKFVGQVRQLGFLAPLLRRILGTNSEQARLNKGGADPATGPIPQTIAVMRTHDQTTPFYMMNLNKYYPAAQYRDGSKGLTGEQAYGRYAKRILPYLLSVGGYPAFMGHVSEVLAGGESSPLHDDWSEFAMVYYPSRRNFLRMMTHTPTKGLHHRTAGLERAVLMPSTDWEVSDDRNP